MSSLSTPFVIQISCHLEVDMRDISVLDMWTEINTEKEKQQNGLNLIALVTQYQTNVMQCEQMILVSNVLCQHWFVVKQKKNNTSASFGDRRRQWLQCSA